jgi:hypothetical protein
MAIFYPGFKNKLLSAILSAKTPDLKLPIISKLINRAVISHYRQLLNKVDYTL